MEYSIRISPLPPREAVIDALYRAVIGLDTKDANMFESAFTRDAVFQRDDTLLEGLEAIDKDLYRLVTKLDTHHTIGNARVDIKENGSTAYMTAYCLAQHHRQGEAMDPTKKGLLGGTTYFIDLVMQSDGVWKIKKWVLKINWCDGDLSVVRGE